MSTIKFGTWQDLSGNEVANSTDPVGESGLVLLTPTSVSGASLSGSTITMSSSSSAYINGIFTSEYDHYQMLARFWGASTNMDVHYQWTSGGTATTSNNYWYAYRRRPYDSSTADADGGIGNSTRIYSGVGVNTSTDTVAATSVDIYNPASSTFRTAFYATAHGNTSTYFYNGNCSGGHRDQSSHDGIRVFNDGSTTFSATIRIYGYRN